MLRALVVAARQPEFSSLLEASGYDVVVQTKPLDGETIAADVAVVFRGRLIGRNQAAALSEAGVPVVEVFTATPTSRSSGTWIRVSNRVSKSDLVQIVHALADARERTAPA